MPRLRLMRITGIMMVVLLSAVVAVLVPIAALPKPVVTCTTDKPTYTVGDSVQVSGLVSSPTGQPLSGATVWIIATDPLGAYVENTQKSSGADGSFSDTFSLQLNATQGNYTLFVSASTLGYQNGNCQSVFAVNKVAADFTMSIYPKTMTIGRGESANYTILISSTTGFTEPVTLTLSKNPLTSTATFSPNPVNPGNVSVLRIATGDTTVLGGYSMIITAKGGSITHTVEANLTVALPFDFAVSITPSTQSVAQGSTEEYSVSVTMWGLGAGATVSLSLLGGAPFSSHLFSPVSGSSNFTSTLTVLTSASTTPGGPYPLVVSASGAGKTRSASASLTVIAVSSPPPFNFAISVLPLAATIAQGMTANYTVSVIGAGTLQTVTLDVPNTIPGAKAELSTQGGLPHFSAALSVKTTVNTDPSHYVFTITATSGTITRTKYVSLFVLEPDFTLAVAPAMLKVVAGGYFSASVQIQPFGDYSQPITLIALSNVGMITAAIHPNTGTGTFRAGLSLHAGQNIPTGNYQVLISATGADGKNHTLPYELYVPLDRETQFGTLEILSNSTLTAFTMAQNEISYQATGDSGAPGFSNVTVPVDLLDGQPTVTIDGQTNPPIFVAQNVTHYLIYFTYTHGSTRSISITGSTPIPEFGILLPIVTSAAVFAATCTCRRKTQKVKRGRLSYPSTSLLSKAANSNSRR